MLKICILVQNFYEIDPRVRREAEAWIEMKAQVDVIGLRAEDDQRSSYELNGVHVYTIPIKKKRGGKLRYIWEYLVFFIAAFLLLSQQMITNHYNVVQVCTLPDFLVFATFIPKLMGASIILDMHEVMPEFFMSKYHIPEDRKSIALLKWLEKNSIRFADHVVTINEPIKDLLISRGILSNKITVVMNSVDQKLFLDQRTSNPNHVKKNFIFMYHGTITFIYGVDLALKAFSMVASQMDNAEFWIVGDGTIRSSLEEFVRNVGILSKVKFIGIVPQHEIPALLSECDVGVLATRQDKFLDLSFSNKLPEYIVMGKPVIVSRLKTISYYFSEDALAYFEPDNVIDLSNRMLSIYNQPELRERMVQRASYEYANINWNIMKKRYIGVINRN
jgi:glycosyltransferase involved in cell wall biosynthesis